jgi:DinB superfamily
MLADRVRLDDALPSWARGLISELDAADQRAIALAKSLTLHQLNWVPRPGAWSVGQCLDHLCISNEEYVAAMSTSLTNRQTAVVQEITPGWFGRWFIRRFIAPSPRSRKVRAPKKIRPGVKIEQSVLERFLASNRAARDLVHCARNYDVNRIRFRNPFIPVIRFTLGTGFELLSQHQRRHLLQAERVRESPEFP